MKEAEKRLLERLRKLESAYPAQAHDAVQDLRAILSQYDVDKAIDACQELRISMEEAQRDEERSENGPGRLFTDLASLSL